MKVVSILGSPRTDGNSAAMARRFTSAADSLGAEVETFALNKLDFRGCQGCLLCKTELDRCALNDDLAEVLKGVRAADVLVMASAIYFGQVTAQLKGFIDRTYSFLNPDYKTDPNPSRLAPGKKMVMILTQGQPDESMYVDVFPGYEKFFRWYGFSDTHLLRACGVFDKGDVEKRPDLMRLVEETAKKVMG